jgi:hypothetical protein
MQKRTPSLLIGAGGTGTEQIMRTRKCIEDKHGSLKAYPIVSFLRIDTDPKEKISNPQAAGSPLKKYEQCLLDVSSNNVRQILENIENYPHIEQWYPPELGRNPSAVSHGAGQVRAHGRFAYYCNYLAVKDAVMKAVRSTQGHEAFMRDNYNIEVNPNHLNIYICCSLAGGTGSGILLDLCYCLSHWLATDANLTVNINTYIALPSLFAGITVGDRLLANHQAALMEYSYYSDHRTRFIAQYTNNLPDHINSAAPPSNFTYLFDTKNDHKIFSPEQTRQMVAEIIAEEIDSNFGAEKLSNRDNLKQSWAQPDAGGRGYPKCFSSFGRYSLAIPTTIIMQYFAYRGSQKLIAYWQNDETALPANMQAIVQQKYLKPWGLLPAILLRDLETATDRPYETVIKERIDDIRTELSEKGLLTCKQVTPFQKETGGICKFVSFMNKEMTSYLAEHLQDLGPDETTHGDFLTKIYDNRRRIAKKASQEIDVSMPIMLSDRNYGPKFTQDFLNKAIPQCRKLQETMQRQRDSYAQTAEESKKVLTKQFQKINADLDKWGLTKQADMKAVADICLQALESYFIAMIKQKSCDNAAIVYGIIERQLDHWNKHLQQFSEYLKGLSLDYQTVAETQLSQVSSTFIEGLELFNQQDLVTMFDNIPQYFVNEDQTESGWKSFGTLISESVLLHLSQEHPNYQNQSFCITLDKIIDIPIAKREVCQNIIIDEVHKQLREVLKSPEFRDEFTAASRLIKVCPSDGELKAAIVPAIEYSQPLIGLSEGTLQRADINFTPQKFQLLGIEGGNKSDSPAVQRLLPNLYEFYETSEIKALGNDEKNQVIFYHEIGGFSLRCLADAPVWRRAYQDWKGKWVEAKRAQLQGEHRELPLPVHICKNPPFWDIFPEDKQILDLIVIARSLCVLQPFQNNGIKQTLIGYQEMTAIGFKVISLATSWEELPQTLSVPTCSKDVNAIKQQVDDHLKLSQTTDGKRMIFTQLTQYLHQRQEELRDQGGKDSQIYQQESEILLRLIHKYELQPSPEPVMSKGLPAHTNRANHSH